MKKIISLIFILCSVSAMAQNDTSNTRYIEVKGNAEMELEPDEIIVDITIEEYWKEEFEKKKDFEDYKNKVPLAIIEDDLIKNLQKAGIKKEDIVVKNLGNYYRYKGKEFLFSKQLEIDVTDLSKINDLMQLADAKGIKSMRIAELKHSDMDKFEQDVKKQALLNAREKAKYLLECIGSELGEIQSVVELTDSYSRPMMAKTMLMSAESGTQSIDQIQNLTISYQVLARFEIK